MATKPANINNDIFSGNLAVTVKGNEGLTKAQRKLLSDAIARGEGGCSLQFGCRIAEDVSEAFSELVITDGTSEYVHNRHSPARFGKYVSSNVPFLTLGLIDPTTKRKFKLTWVGENIPEAMKRAAVKHDKGQLTKSVDIELPLSAALVVDTTNPVKYAPRPKKPGPAKRRRHDRVTIEDLKR